MPTKTTFTAGLKTFSREMIRGQMRTNLLIGLVINMVSCGMSRPSVEPRPSGSLDLPTFPNQQPTAPNTGTPSTSDPSSAPPGTNGSPKDFGFGLTTSATTQVYEGRLIFWDAKATPERIRDVNLAVIQGRLRKQAALEFAAKEVIPLRGEVASRLKTIELAQAAYVQAGANGLRDPELVTMARQGSEQWFETTLARLTQQDSYVTSQDSVIRLRWQAYCDGKIWEMATSTLSLEEYTTRPTPHAFCEPYYRSQRYFNDDARCASSTEGKSFFQCLWQDGLMKTPQWLSLTSDGTTAKCSSQPGSILKQAALEAWLKPPFEGAPSALEKLLRKPLQNGEQTKFASAVLGGSPFRKSEFSEDTMVDLGLCPTAFQRKVGQTTELLSQANPKRLLEIVEIDFERGEETKMRPLFPRRAPDQKALDQDLYKSMTLVARMLGTRFSTESGLTLSVNDILFNPPIGKTLNHQSNDESRGKESLELYWNLTLPENEAEADPLFRPMIARKNATSAGLKADVLTAESAYQAAQTAFDSKKAHLDQLLGKEQGATADGIRAVNIPDTTVFFSTFGLKITRLSDTLRVEWTLDESTSQCIPIGEKGDCSLMHVTPPHPLHSLTSGSAPLKLEFDPDANKITLNFQLDEPERFGLRELRRSPEALARALTDPLQRFNDVGSAQWKNRRLEIEIYGQRMNDVVDIFTGNAYLWDGDQKILWGSVSGDRFDQMLRQM